ncbi:hypothetical protein [Mycobacterium sp. 1245852.3]|uniref:hypothetical protein n=1 Tax=Mycobacterium sp. 1245852.3 TaxID=1856860 RepID=UPI0012E9F6B9|nr:hypothetical protein [Mycobacterium sp. 1245852.3]
MWEGAGQDRQCLAALPDPQMICGPGYLEWAIRGSAGSQSLKWHIGATTKGHLYIGAEQLSGTLALGLHQGQWLVDFHGDFARPRIPPERQLSICDYWFAPPDIDGWFLAAVIMVQGIVEPIDQTATQCGTAAQSWPAPYWPQHLFAQVLVGHADQPPPTMTDALGLIGQITLGSGRTVRVSAGIRTREGSLDRFISTHQRHHSSVSGAKFAWGHTDDIPILIDLAGIG